MSATAPTFSWQQEMDLGARRIVYIWSDGVYFLPRWAEEKQCVLVLIGADEWRGKEVLGLIDGYRESTQSWRELLLDLKLRGLTRAPQLTVGDGALGFWAALREVFGATREQRCWVHKTGNVLNAMPKSAQPKARGHLQGPQMGLAESVSLLRPATTLAEVLDSVVSTSVV